MTQLQASAGCQAVVQQLLHYAECPEAAVNRFCAAAESSQHLKEQAGMLCRDDRKEVKTAWTAETDSHAMAAASSCKRRAHCDRLTQSVEAPCTSLDRKLQQDIIGRGRGHRVLCLQISISFPREADRRKQEPSFQKHEFPRLQALQALQALRVKCLSKVCGSTA